MHPMFADWYRLADLKPDAEALEKRWQAIAALQENAPTEEWLDCVRLFVGRPQGEVTHAAKFAQRFKEADPLFPLLKNELELQVLAGAALMQLLEKPSHAADAAALAMVCVDCRGEGSQGPIPEAVATARKYLAEEAIRMRETEQSQPAPLVPIKFQGQPFKEIADLTVQSIQGNWPYADARFTQVATWNNELLAGVKAMHTAVGKMVETVNAALKQVAQPTTSKEVEALREETNILWWLFGERSRDLDIPIKEVKFPAICLIAAKEMADLTAILPGPVAARAVLGKALGTAGKAPAAVKLQDAVNASSREWRERWMGSAAVGPIADLAPVLRAVGRSLEVENAGAWVPVYNKGAVVKADVSLPPLDLACQLYDESLLLRAQANGV